MGCSGHPVPLDRVLDKQDKTLYTTSLVIAQGVGNDHGSVTKVIRKSTKRLEKFGLIRFEIQLRSEGQRGSDTNYPILNKPHGRARPTWQAGPAQLRRGGEAVARRQRPEAEAPVVARGARHRGHGLP